MCLHIGARDDMCYARGKNKLNATPYLRMCLNNNISMCPTGKYSVYMSTNMCSLPTRLRHLPQLNLNCAMSAHATSSKLQCAACILFKTAKRNVAHMVLELCPRLCPVVFVELCVCFISNTRRDCLAWQKKLCDNTCCT